MYTLKEDLLGFKKGHQFDEKFIEEVHPNWIKHMEKVHDPLDLNKDGKVDSKDAKIGSKVMNKIKSKKKKKRGK